MSLRQRRIAVFALAVLCVGASSERASDRRRQVETAGLSHVLRGVHFLSRGHASASIPHFRLALLYDSSSPFIHLKLSEAWQRTGDIERAKRVIAAGLRHAPKDPGLNLSAGALALAARDYRSAQSYLEHAIASSNTLERAGPMLIESMLWAGRADQAWPRATRLADAARANVELAYALGAVFEDHGDLEHALRMYRRAQRQRPASRPTGIGLMRVQELREEPVKAAEALVDLFSFYPTDPVLYIYAFRLYRRAQRVEADAYRREAERLAADDSRSMALVADGLASEGHVDEAIRYLEGAAPQAPEPLYHRYLAELEYSRQDYQGCLKRLGSLTGLRASRRRARCFAAQGKLNRAMKSVYGMSTLNVAADIISQEAALVACWDRDLESARTRFREFAVSHGGSWSDRDRELGEAIVSDHFGASDDALERLEPLFRLQPNDDELAFRLSDLYVRAGRLRAGIGILEELLASEPGDPTRLNALGFTLADLGDRRDLIRAEVLLRRAYRLSLDEGYIVDSLGWWMYRSGRLSEALALVTRALKIDGPDPEVLRHLGDIERALGHETNARTHYRDALVLNPSASLRAVIMDRLKQPSSRGVRASQRKFPPGGDR